MIIGTTDDTLDVATLLDGLGQASRGLVRVGAHGSGGINSIGSGWLVTDDLVMMPTFVLQELGDEVDCYQGDATFIGEVVAPGIEDTSPALVRLNTPLTGHALKVATTKPVEGQSIYVLHHPRGATAQKLSIGRLLLAHDDEIRYDADTEGGSSGGPVLDAHWTVVGMHVRRSTAPDEPYNAATTVTAIREALKDSKLWREIADFQRLADPEMISVALSKAPAAATEGGTELLAAAVRWDFDPALLSEYAVAEIESFAAKPRSGGGRWVLSASARIAALRAAGSLDALRAARGDAVIEGHGQAVIDRILKGPPFDLADIDEEALPHWLQATRWFADVVPGVPSPDEVRRVLAQRRVRSRLEAIRSSSFQGRDQELAELRAWHVNSGAAPMVITGIGGVGKSALVAAFALELPSDTLQLWLDFDRADLTADDPKSVLRLLFEQMETQLDGFDSPQWDESTWSEAVAALAPALAPSLSEAPPALLVLDGFEVAQHAIQHREIWRLLEALQPALPGVRLIVSGRAPVRDLNLGGIPAESMHLKGLARPDAIAWLLQQGFDEHFAGRIFDITRGVPLGLRLAARWRREGGKESELPDEGAPQWYIDGFLYRRILDRVIDDELVGLARDALVLRRLTPEMIPAVLFDSAPPGDAPEVFARLAREFALVGEGDEGADILDLALPGTNTLRLRPEVRSAALNLLIAEDAERVRAIDLRAAQWYANADGADVINAAELVYHRLRLGDVEGAREAWRGECAPLLRYAEEDIPPGPARDWLRGYTLAPNTDPISIEAWEHSAHARIVDLLQRGQIDLAPSILEEEMWRTTESPLILYDALMHRWQGDHGRALDVLNEHTTADGTVGRDRTLMAAWLYAELDRRDQADRLLSQLDRADVWENRPNPTLDMGTVAAARIRLRIDFSAELRLAELLERGGRTSLQLATRYLPRIDTVAPPLSDVLGDVSESRPMMISIPPAGAESGDFGILLDRVRRGSAEDCQLITEVVPKQIRLSELVDTDAEVWRETGERLAMLSRLAADRWRYAITSRFLGTATELAVRSQPAKDPQIYAVVGALAAFASSAERAEAALYHPLTGELDSWFLKFFESNPWLGLGYGPKPAKARFDAARSLDLDFTLQDLLMAASESWEPMTLSRFSDVIGLVSSSRQIALFHLLAPDPLEMLVRRVAGISDKFAF